MRVSKRMMDCVNVVGDDDDDDNGDGEECDDDDVAMMMAGLTVSWQVKGGILADDMGLGKTLQVLNPCFKYVALFMHGAGRAYCCAFQVTETGYRAVVCWHSVSRHPNRACSCQLLYGPCVGGDPCGRCNTAKREGCCTHIAYMPLPGALVDPRKPAARCLLSCSLAFCSSSVRGYQAWLSVRGYLQRQPRDRRGF